MNLIDVWVLGALFAIGIMVRPHLEIAKKQGLCGLKLWLAHLGILVSVLLAWPIWLGMLVWVAVFDPGCDLKEAIAILKKGESDEV
jgi:hypothetical protein